MSIEMSILSLISIMLGNRIAIHSECVFTFSQNNKLMEIKELKKWKWFWLMSMTKRLLMTLFLLRITLNKPKMAYSRNFSEMAVWQYGLILQWYFLTRDRLLTTSTLVSFRRPTFRPWWSEVLKNGFQALTFSIFENIFVQTRSNLITGGFFPQG